MGRVGRTSRGQGEDEPWAEGRTSRGQRGGRAVGRTGRGQSGEEVCMGWGIERGNEGRHMRGCGDGGVWETGKERERRVGGEERERLELRT